jgi:hypothetical protein
MISDVKSTNSGDIGATAGAARQETDPNSWLKVGAIAAASAMLGGLAAAWFYRRTLTQLREAENEIPDSESRIIEDESGEDF